MPTNANAYGSQTAGSAKPKAAATTQGSASSVPAEKNAAGTLTRTR
jgi:hypothetical protein